jgi:hypothetical protein
MSALASDNLSAESRTPVMLSDEVAQYFYAGEYCLNAYLPDDRGELIGPMNLYRFIGDHDGQRFAAVVPVPSQEGHGLDVARTAIEAAKSFLESQQ